MARKRIKRVHINMHVIRKNTKEGTEDPPITVKVGKENHRCSEAEILGPSKLIYSPHKLNCGARLVLMTTSDIALDGDKVVS